MALLAQLWAAGITAQMLPRESPSLAEQYAYADACGAKWLVILDEKALQARGGGGGGAASGSWQHQQGGAWVRVKRWRRGPDDGGGGGGGGSGGRLRRGEDSSVQLSDLPRFLQMALSGAQDPGRGLAAGGAGGGSFGAGSGASVLAGGGVGGAGGGGVAGPMLHRSGSGADLLRRGAGAAAADSSMDSGEYSHGCGAAGAAGAGGPDGAAAGRDHGHGGHRYHGAGGWGQDRAGEGRRGDRAELQQAGRHRDRRR
jgi:hypothetical protein